MRPSSGAAGYRVGDRTSRASGAVGIPSSVLLHGRHAHALGIAARRPSKKLKDYETYGHDCDLIWSRSEFDPNGPVVARRVLAEVYPSGPGVEPALRHAADRDDGGASVLRRRQRLDADADARDRRPQFVSRRDGWVRVEGVADSGRVETVYNLEVEDDHTYFVGSEEWGFAVWANNAGYAEEEAVEVGEINPTSRRRAGVLTEAEQNPQHHLFPQEESAWFDKRGINVDDHTITIDRTLHEALHAGGGPGRGGGWWNNEMMQG